VHRYPCVYEVVTDLGGKVGAKLHCFVSKAWVINNSNMSELLPRIPKLTVRSSTICATLTHALTKCAHEHPGVWHKHVSGMACDLRAAHQDTLKMSPTMARALWARGDPILSIEREIPTLSTLRQPNLDQDETEEQRKERNMSEPWSTCNLI
jgi:hypothetical protein